MRIEIERCKDYFQYMLDAIEKPAIIVGFDGQIQYINVSYQQCFGIDTQQKIQEVLAVESLVEWQIVLSRIKAEGTLSCNLTFYLENCRETDTKVDLFYVENSDHIFAILTPEKSPVTVDQVNWEAYFTETDHIKLFIDMNGKIIQKNTLAQSFFSLNGKDLIGQECLSVLEKKFQESFKLDMEAITKLNETGQCTMQLVHTLESNLVYYRVQIKKIIADTMFYYLTMSDETEQVIARQRLTQKDSLLEIGQLAASIAHEIRNPITTLKGFTQLLKISAEEDSLKYLEVIDDEIERMEHILSEMLKLSKPADVKKSYIPLDELLLDLERIMYPKATIEGVKIITTLKTPSKVFVLGDEQKLKQVLLNLMKNSLEAMNDAGVLQIELEHFNEDYVNLTLTDNGKGIEQEHLKQVFMPYFTTRQDGTGLGLPFVLKTVQEHNGKITVSSEVNKGTRFIITFPITKEQFISSDVNEEEHVGAK